MDNGGSRPAWIDWPDGTDFMEIQRLLDVETFKLRVKAILANGRTAKTTVEVDLRTGTVVEVGKAFSQDQTLDEQLALEGQRLADGSAELIQALAF